MTKAKLEHLMVELNIEDDSDGSDHEVETSFVDEFHALAKARKWKIGSKAWRRNWAVYTQAENERLSSNHGARLKRWKQMCVKLGVEPATSIGQCRKALSRIFVNLVDVVECWATGECPKRFENARQLAEYTWRERKSFNRDLIKKDDVLRVFMKRLA